MSPSGRISLEELATDIAERGQSNGRHNGHAKPRKGKGSFPLDIFPPKLEELIRGAETAQGAPPDFMAASCLLAVAAAAGGTYQLQVKNGSIHRPIFFLCLIGRPNVNKSGPLRFALEPIIRRDGERYDAYKLEKAAYDAIDGMTKKDRQAEGITEMPPTPVYTHTLTNDATPEALASAHNDNPKGITVFRDELAGWVKDFNRYHAGGEAEGWLTIWYGAPLTIDRKTSGPIHLKFTNINVCGTIQPAVIEELAGGGRGMNGFIDRVLFAWPEGLEKPEWTADELSLPLQQAYHNAINKLLDLSFSDSGEANMIALKPEAQRRLIDFFNQDNKPLCDEAESELLAGIYGKFDVHTARLILVLHLLWWAYEGAGAVPQAVDVRAVERAIIAARYFREQALKVYNRLYASNPIEQLPSDKKRVYDALPETFQTKDGEAIAVKNGMPSRTFRHFLKTEKGKLFESLAFGKWAKIY